MIICFVNILQFSSEEDGDALFEGNLLAAFGTLVALGCQGPLKTSVAEEVAAGRRHDLKIKIEMKIKSAFRGPLLGGVPLV